MRRQVARSAWHGIGHAACRGSSRARMSTMVLAEYDFASGSVGPGSASVVTAAQQLPGMSTY